jgi:hypothetical protein
VSGFSFKTNDPKIEIEGKHYPVNFGDPTLQKEIMEFGLELGAAPLTPEVFEFVHKRTHEFFAILLGSKAVEEIFAGKEVSIVDDLSLMAYIQEQINALQSVQDLIARLGRFAPQATK